MSSIQLDDYKRYMEYLRRKYLEPKTDCERLIRSLIDELYCQYTMYGKEINYFEMYYGKDRFDYVYKKNAEYDREKVPQSKRKNDAQLSKEWEKEADDHEYFAMLASTDFIAEIINILDTNYSRTFVTTDILKKLANKKSGIIRVDLENMRLLSLFERKTEEDLDKYSMEQSKRVEKDIDRLRRTTFYRHKTNKGIARRGDRQFIGNKESYTFAQVFEELKVLAEVPTIDTENDKLFSNGLDYESYEKRIEKLTRKVEIIKSLYKQHINEQYQNDIFYTLYEQEQMNNIREEVYSKIVNLESVHDQIVARQKKYSKVIETIEAIQLRLEAIDIAIGVLSDDRNSYTEGTNEVSIFQGTLKMLKEERHKCIEYLKKYGDIVTLLDKLFNDVHIIINDINELNAAFDKIVLDGKKRKNEEDNKGNVSR